MLARGVSIDSIMALPRIFSTDEIAAPRQKVEGRGILQREFAVTDAHSVVPIIGTTGMGPCISITVYDGRLRRAAIAHIDHLTELDSLTRVFNNFRPYDDRRLEVRLFGGDPESPELAVNIAGAVARVRDALIVSSDIITPGRPSSIAIDARTGTVIAHATPADFGPDLDKRLARAALPKYLGLIREFDGTSASLS